MSPGDVDLETPDGLFACLAASIRHELLPRAEAGAAPAPGAKAGVARLRSLLQLQMVHRLGGEERGDWEREKERVEGEREEGE